MSEPEITPLAPTPFPDSAPSGKKGGGSKSEAAVCSPLQSAAIGLEAEFDLVLDGEPRRPEDVFRSPRSFIRGPLMHRQGTSYHLPTGGAVYFDTGVIEVATPVIEIDRGCAARAGRSLWEAIHYVRRELDAWEERTGTDARLVGFSSHYNVSFELAPDESEAERSVEKLALLLTYILPQPVMLLATNRRSTGVGVRPRGDRIEITVDFTPSPALMIAAVTVVTGIVREVMTWPSFELDELARHGLPVLVDFRPIPHTTRKGWLANIDCYERNPFVESIDEAMWRVRHGRHHTEEEIVALRLLAKRIVYHFRDAIRRIADPFSRRLIESVVAGHSPTLLDLDDRPEAYEDVGNLCRWDNLFPEKVLARSRYEQVLVRAISGQDLDVGGHRYRPVGMRGWSEVIFRRRGDGRRVTVGLDQLVRRLDRWR